MLEYKGAGTNQVIVHEWADNHSLNRHCIRLDDGSCWMFGFTSSKNWHKGDTVRIVSTNQGYDLHNVSRSGRESAKFLGYAEG